MIRKKGVERKQQIISEYLTGDQSFEALGIKYGVKSRTIQSWVRSYRKQHGVKESVSPVVGEDAKSLKKQLELSKLKNELLEEMLRLSEEQTGIDFRKKFGTRQS